ncbi:MAG: cytochrome c family protein [bacterium]
MRKLIFFYLASCLILFVTFLKVEAQEKKEAEPTFKYGGVATCKACHLTKKSGAQYKIWQKSAHAKAYETLKTPAAKEFAKKAGIEDPLKSEKCLKCHVTAFGVDEKLKGAKLTMEEGVSCESCHGPGSGYKGKKVMTDIYEGKVEGAKYGLVQPTEEVCVTCHNEESPSYKKFKYAERVAKIAHPVPKKEE